MHAILSLCSRGGTLTHPSAYWAMAVEAENMTYDDLKEVTDGLTLRSIAATVSPELPRGCFDWLAFPKDELNSSECPVVHFYDVIVGYQGEINFHALGTTYRTEMP